MVSVTADLLDAYQDIPFGHPRANVPDRVLVREAGKGLPPPGPRSVGYDTRQSV